MFQNILVSPSILSADFMNLENEIAAIERAGTDWVHFDVIDGEFAPNLTIGVPVLRKLRSITSLPLDVHLMICNPLSKLEWFLDCKPDYVTFHWEALQEGREDEQCREAVDLIHNAGAKAGIAIKPDTPTDVLSSTIHLWDMVLVMSVFPGFSGQSYIPESKQRVRNVCQMCREAGVAPLIQVDGGMAFETAPLVASEGADVLVAGNAVFAQEDYAAAIASIKNAAENARTQEASLG